MATHTLSEKTADRQTVCQLYRQFDCDGVLLYVGVSENAQRRQIAHRYSSWAGQIAKVTVEDFPTKAAAHAAERAAILAEAPMFNRMKRRQALNLDQLERNMTVAERQQLKRDRLKAGLVRLELWVPADKEADVLALVAAATQDDAQLPKDTAPP